MNNVIQLKLRLFRALIAVGLAIAWLGVTQLAPRLSGLSPHRTEATPAAIRPKARARF
jgi:hypothetical protein